MIKNNKFDIMVAGHLCLDLIPRFLDNRSTQIQDVIVPGKLINTGDCAISTGGLVSNSGIGLRALGHKVCFCARVGDDYFGRLTQDILDREGNSEGIRVIENQSSSYTIVLALPNIDRIFMHHPGTNDLFGPDDLNSKLIGQCRHFHFGYAPLMQNMYMDNGAALKKVFQAAGEAGAITSCDMSLPDPDSESGKAPWKKILENILPYVDIFLPSVEESLFMLDPDAFIKLSEEERDTSFIDKLHARDYSNLADEILEMGAGMTSLKTGHRGFYFKTGAEKAVQSICEKSGHSVNEWADRELWCPAFMMDQIASATGSGDASITGFLSAFMRRLPLETCLKYACILGWSNLHAFDAVSGVKSWEESSEILTKKIPLINSKINSPDWSWIDDKQVWAGQEDLLSRNIT